MRCPAAPPDLTPADVLKAIRGILNFPRGLADGCIPPLVLLLKEEGSHLGPQGFRSLLADLMRHAYTDVFTPADILFHVDIVRQVADVLRKDQATMVQEIPFMVRQLKESVETLQGQCAALEADVAVWRETAESLAAVRDELRRQCKVNEAKGLARRHRYKLKSKVAREGRGRGA